MEDTHGAGLPRKPKNDDQIVVLILIIMEDTHGELVLVLLKIVLSCLNPYYNGRYSWSDSS